MAVELKAEALQATLERRNLTQRQLARMLDVSPATITLWVQRRRRPGAASRRQLLDVLGVEFERLFSQSPTTQQRPARSEANVG